MLCNDLRSAYHMIRWTKKYARENGLQARDIAKLVRELRGTIHRISGYFNDPFEKSMRDEWRHHYYEESGVDYICVEDNGETDEEIDDFIDCEVGYPPITSPFDCTGKRFTCGKSWTRKSGMIAIIHCWGLDV